MKDIPTHQKCSKCGEVKPLNVEYFNKGKNYKYGFIKWCKECKTSYNKKYREPNKEKQKEYHKEYYKENKNMINERSRKYYQENKEFFVEYQIMYAKDNPDRKRKHSHDRRARVKKVPHTITVEEWEDTLEFFNHSCAYCGDNECYLEQEHVIPVVQGGGYEKENIIPACRTCNARKSSKVLLE